MKGLGQEIIANSQQRERALESLEEARFKLPHAIDCRVDPYDRFMKRLNSGKVLGAGRLVQMDVQTRQQIRSATDPAVTSQQNGLSQKLLRSHQQSEVRPFVQHGQKLVEVQHAGGAILDPD